MVVIVEEEEVSVVDVEAVTVEDEVVDSAEEDVVIAEAAVEVEEVHLEVVEVLLAEDVEVVQRVVQRPLWRHIVTLVSSSHAARKICWSPRTSHQVNQSTARSASASRTLVHQTQTEPQAQPKPSTESGILSEASWLLVSWVVWTRSSSSPEQRFFTSEPPPELQFPTSLISLDLRDVFLPSSSRTDLVVI